MSNVQKFLFDQSKEYAKVVVPVMTRGVPLKTYTEKSFDFPKNHAPLIPVSKVGPIPVSTRVVQKNFNVV